MNKICIIIDDLQTNRFILSALVRNYDKELLVMDFSSAKDALDAYDELTKSNHNVDVFLTDQRMPEMTGIEMAVELRKLSYKGIIAIVTAFTDLKNTIPDWNEVVDEILTKPLGKKELHSYLQEKGI